MKRALVLVTLLSLPAWASPPLPRTHLLAWVPTADVAAPPPRSHTFSWVMFGLAAASAIGAGVGGVGLLDYHSFVQKAEHNPGSVSWTQANDKRNTAQVYTAFSLGLSVNAVGALTSGWVAW